MTRTRAVGPCTQGPTRPVELALNASVTVSAVAGHLVEDPLLLLLQVVRRLPRPLAAALTSAPLPAGHRHARGPSLRGALRSWVSGAPSEAVTTLGEALSTRPPTSPRSLRGRLATELAIQLGHPDVMDPVLAHAAPTARARAAWQRGDVGDAIGLAGAPGGSTPLRDRFVSEARTLQPGWWPRLPPADTSGVGAHRSPGDGVAAFHVLTNSLPHTQSGYTLRSHAVLAAQREAGIRVEAATRLGYPVSIGALLARHCDTVDGLAYRRAVPVRAARTAEGRARQGAELLLPHVERFTPHVLHTTTNYANALVTRTLADRLGIPWVYEVRGLLEETWVAGRPTAAERERAARSERHELLRARETEMAQAADAVVTLSATLRDELVDRGVRAETITVVPNGVDAGLLTRTSSPSAARRVVGLPREGFWVGTVSSLVDYEGLDTLIDAVAELRARGVDARALVVGDGVSRPHLERRAAVAGLGPHAVFTGRVPRHLAPTYHEALDVLVVPRRDLRVCRKVTPSKPLEAMAVGRPVVVSDLPALAELVAPHGSGRVVPPDDAGALADCLEELHGAPELRSQHAAAGRAFAATRTWSAAGVAYRRLYEGLTRAGVA